MNGYHRFGWVDIDRFLQAGRSDLEMNGIPGTDFHNDCRMVEFKYFKANDAKKVAMLTEARPEDIEQVKEYATGINQKFPNYRIRTYTLNGHLLCILLIDYLKFQR